MTEEDERRPRPREFLRRRRPEYFSDTPQTGRPRLDRTVLEYHLSTLTSRSEELAFEKFALALCKLTVAPNLMPHTGPTGGGDSKVDTETFLVAGELTLAWYVGTVESAAQERWGFAFSAKADWKPKVKSDVAKIAATARGYTKAFFVSSQSIPDKDRAAVEDDLTAEHGLAVRIYDRNWILDRVFEAHHEELVVRLLDLQVRLDEPGRPGPLDASRIQRIDEVDEDVRRAVEEGAVGPRVVERAIESAVIARELERSRDEVDGRLDRAGRLAEQHGLREQQARVEYERAFTAYWWYEDGAAFAHALDSHEALVKPNRDATSLRRLVTLYYLASAGVRESWTANSEWIRERRTVIDEATSEMAANDAAPSAALSAKVTRELLRIFDDPGTADTALGDMERLVDEAEGLLGFDLPQLAEEVGELGSVLGASAAFDALHDRLVGEVQRRAGDGAGGEMHTSRAIQLYGAGRYLEAIVAAGRALPLLAGHEWRATMLRALDVIADSYLQMGLPWAARGSWLVASALLGADGARQAEALPRLVYVFDRLRGVELRLGRLPESLSIHRLCEIAGRATSVDDVGLGEVLATASVSYEAALTHALMRVPHSSMPRLARLPDALARLGLDVARSGLLLAMGHDVPPSPTFPGPGEAADFLRLLRDAPDGPRVDADLLEASRTHILKSRVLGVAIEAEHESGSPGTEIAESCLGAIEALLSTGASHPIMGAVPTIRLTIRRGHFTPRPFRVVTRADLPENEVEIAFADFDPSVLSQAEQEEIRTVLKEATGRVLTVGFHLGPIEQTLEDLLGHERALDRSLNFALSFVTAGDLLRPTRERGLDALLEATDSVYQVRGDAAWIPPAAAARPRPVDVRDGLRSVPHDRMRVRSSVIDVPLWNRARWRGVFYAVMEGAPPLLALGFADGAAATLVWEGWMSRRRGLDEFLQISIVTTINSSRPFDYKVLVAPTWDGLKERDDDVDIVTDVIRIHEMNPTSDENLDRFRVAFERAGRAYVGVAVMPPDLSPEGVRHVGNAPLRAIKIRRAEDLRDGDWELPFTTLRAD